MRRCYFSSVVPVCTYFQLTHLSQFEAVQIALDIRRVSVQFTGYIDKAFRRAR